MRFKSVLLFNGFINFLAQIVEDFAGAAGNVYVF